MRSKLVLILITVFIYQLDGLSQTPNTISQPQKKIALVIGNGNYQSSGILANPENDARAMKVALQNVGFTVMEYENLSQSQMKKAIDDFGDKLKSNEVGLFFYAGHGIQAKGYNYLIPVDALLKSEQQVEYDCVQADRILALMEASGAKVNIIILDACRNNPFERSWTRSETGKGLAFMNAPKGTLIAYATSPGSTASDGSGNNGLYTSAILESIKIPNITILQMFQQVRSIVSQKSNEKQTPWESTSLTGDFYLNTGVIVNNEIQEIPKLAKSTADSIQDKNATIKNYKNLKFNSVLISGAIPYAPLGIKYQYCKSFGAYASFKTGITKRDTLNNCRNILLTLGAVKSIGQKFNIYFGGGIDLESPDPPDPNNYDFKLPVIEGGVILRLGLTALDFGAGMVFYRGAFGTLGIGFNF